MVNEISRKILNVEKTNVMPICEVREFDNVILKLALYKNSTALDITGQTVRLGAKTSKGLIEQIDGFTISKNNLDIELKNSILVPGKIEIDLEFKDANGSMTTASFFIVVKNKVLNDKAVEATNEFSTFTRIEENYNNFKNEVNSSLEDIENEIEDLKQSGGGGGDIDLSDYATKTELNCKADITTVSSHTNDTTSHITSAERSSWNNKSNFDGNYNSLTNKPTIPTTTSQLTNNSGFITSIPSEYITESELNSKGYLTSHQSLAEYPKTSELTLGVYTDGLVYLFKGGQPTGVGVELGGTNAPIVGYVDSENNIVLSGALADGAYTLKYTMEDGSLVEIGDLNLTGDQNAILTSVGLDGSTPFETNGIKYGYRLSSAGSYSQEADYNSTGLIKVDAGDIVYLKNSSLYSKTLSTNASRIVFFTTSRTHKSYYQPWNSTSSTTEITDVLSGTDGQITQFKVVNNGYFALVGFSSSGLALVSVSTPLDSLSVVKINKPIS